MPFIRRVARRMGVPEADLDDAVQETMLAAMTSAHTFEAGRHERAWLFGIARNCARRVFRRAREVAFAEPPEQAVSGGQQRAVAEQQARSLVHRALDELPEAQ
ncbi:MAG: sigma-70 family RNA polymerase sigma factor, partial [Myxococcales bacterium]|nr:sigma-70 family RNA polymerase sigma factor [Myxococcales bacterium]